MTSHDAWSLFCIKTNVMNWFYFVSIALSSQPEGGSTAPGGVSSTCYIQTKKKTTTRRRRRRRSVCCGPPPSALLRCVHHGQTLLRDELPQLHGERPHGQRPQLLQVPRLEEDGGGEGGRGHPEAADGLGGRREQSQHHLQLRPRLHEGLLQALPHR